MTDLAANLTALDQCFAELEATILSGWPDSFGLPSEWEAQAIESCYHELSLHEPGLGDNRCWQLAGWLVARFRRDVRAAPQETP